MAERQLYKVIFNNQGKVYEIYARQIYQSELYGFIEIEELVFGSTTQLVVDPSEERLRSEFDSVTRSYIPIHSVVRIDEVEREGVAKISESTGGSNVTPFPLPAFRPGGHKE